MIHNFAAQVGQGSRVQTAVARIAQTYHEASNNTVGGGVCRCHGGSSFCTGCETIPIYRTQSRMKGDDGPKGRTGNPIEDMLLRGTAGVNGQAQVIVRHSNGDRVVRIYEKFARYKEKSEEEDGAGPSKPLVNQVNTEPITELTLEQIKEYRKAHAGASHYYEFLPMLRRCKMKWSSHDSSLFCEI